MKITQFKKSKDFLKHCLSKYCLNLKFNIVSNLVLFMVLLNFSPVFTPKGDQRVMTTNN